MNVCDDKCDIRDSIFLTVGESRGVGFCRMESREVCERIVMELNKKTIPRSKEPLLVKFADSGNKRRREFRYQHGMMAYDNMHHG